MNIYFATNNKNKALEAQAIIASAYNFKPIDSKIQWEESGDTYLENALIKLKACWSYYGPSYAIAEDSGLEVDALGGRPGLYSARYSSTPIATLLEELKEIIPLEQRTARFRCVLCFADAQTGLVYSFEGCYEGLISPRAQGQDGFGYDPIFYCPKIKLTFAEWKDKSLYSHRALALLAWKKAWTHYDMPMPCAKLS